MAGWSERPGQREMILKAFDRPENRNEKALGDAVALEVMRLRLVAEGQHESRKSYSDLVRDIPFWLPGEHHDRPFWITRDSWTDHNRGLVGQFLGYLSEQSYRQNLPGFFISALAVSSENGSLTQPSPAFFRWMRQLGALTQSGGLAEVEFWAEHVQRSYTWSRNQPRVTEAIIDKVLAPRQTAAMKA